ncbi:PQQ-dependent sugar dehydrogenase [Flocculibacter collagenilyticus]|uniref:PQQ-dependent sugar dehydrogenase n=1 Tax=Flocculibacter collagenilyticus TaxID=2744479 RepID=UPI0018F3D060|nr:PQQ-dependent sugar dehydrogenase [Flocculibacter collagenilyticus]
MQNVIKHRSIVTALIVCTVILSFFNIEAVSAKSNNKPQAAPMLDAKAFPAFKLVQVTSGLSHPWAIAFLPDNRLLVTERSGNLRIVEQGKLSAPVENVPASYVRSQGGLMDVVLHPDYKNNGWIYLTHAYGDADKNATRLFRAKLKDNALVDVQTLFTVSPMKDTPVHYGGRITFLPDNTLVLTSGDGFDYREEAQKLDNLLGKMIRLNDDGTIPTDNPFVGQAGKRDEIWSYGHRNPQGIVYDAQRKWLVSNEHGPKGGDEINIITAGKNYGWPVITYGRDYSGAIISPYTEYDGMQQPFVDWTPSIAPSSLTVYQGNMFPEINGDYLASALKYRELRWVKMQGNKVVGQASLLKDLGERIRDVNVAPDGAIYIATDSTNGKIYKLIKH